MPKLDYHQIMWAEQKPDFYAGPTCDQQKPGWDCYAEGDMDSESGLEVIELAARTFPPGTKIVVSVPICPECSEQVELCDCGFDWESWARDQYS
jgi:hypothetical protein